MNIQALRALLPPTTRGPAFWRRIALAVVMFPHGAQKVFGWFGGFGYHATLDAMSGKMGIPKPLVVLVMLAEALGSNRARVRRAHARGRVRHQRGHARRDHARAPARRVLHELDRCAGRRGHRVSRARARAEPSVDGVGRGPSVRDGALARRISRMRPGRGAPYAEHGGVHAPVVGRQVYADGDSRRR